MSARFSKETATNECITVVSGLPRSGTSMMMKMLSAGNMPLLIDEIRMPDEDNPKGYFEFERVKELKDDNSWLEMARGRAVKIVSPLLFYLNLGTHYRYKILFMLRNINEIIVSQNKMAYRLKPGEDDIEDNVLMQNYSLHLREIQEWEKQKENIDVMYLNYTDVIKTPRAAAQRICSFLDLSLNRKEMSAVIDDSLYRQRVEKPEDDYVAVVSEENKDNDIIAERLKHLGYL